MSISALVWFRLDLRLHDNPALDAAAEYGHEIIPVFIWAPEEEGDWPPGEASRWWLHQSLKALDSDLRIRGSRLILRRGPTIESLKKLIHESGARAVFWNRRYEPALRARDARLLKILQSDGIRVETFNSTLLYPPEEIKNSSGRPFRVFTPFWKACLAAGPYWIKASPPVKWRRNRLESLSMKELSLEPVIDWAKGLRDAWQPGEAGAQKLLQHFFENSLRDYALKRDFPSLDGTSRLSPHLHFGEISPHRIRSASSKLCGSEAAAFLRQLGWREFAHYLLYHFPDTTEIPFQSRFKKFRWKRNRKKLQQWQKGLTGFPIVDAGMRQLWATGWMHNRVRMLAGSFLVKDLMISWKFGARWFWNTLVDADLANNTLGWQWVAGCGADAAPYFRIFNPTKQAERYDPENIYVKKWIPELESADYTNPIVDHSQAREIALEAYRNTRT